MQDCSIIRTYRVSYEPLWCNNITRHSIFIAMQWLPECVYFIFELWMDISPASQPMYLCNQILWIHRRAPRSETSDGLRSLRKWKTERTREGKAKSLATNLFAFAASHPPPPARRLLWLKAHYLMGCWGKMVRQHARNQFCEYFSRKERQR